MATRKEALSETASLLVATDTQCAHLLGSPAMLAWQEPKQSMTREHWRPVPLHSCRTWRPGLVACICELGVPVSSQEASGRGLSVGDTCRRHKKCLGKIILQFLLVTEETVLCLVLNAFLKHISEGGLCFMGHGMDFLNSKLELI